MIKIFFPWISIIDLYSPQDHTVISWLRLQLLQLLGLMIVDWTDKSSKCRLFVKTLTCTIATPQQQRFCNLRLTLTFASSRFLGTKHWNLKNTKTCATLVGDERNPTRVFLNLLPIVLMNGGSTIVHIIQIAKKDMCLIDHVSFQCHTDRPAVSFNWVC